MSLPDPSCVRIDSHQPLPKNTSSQNHSLQHKRSRQLADYAKEAARITQEQLFQLLLQVTPHTEPHQHCTDYHIIQVARLEQLLRGMYQKVLAARATQWDSLRAECVARMEELAEVFGGRQQLSRVVPSKKLEVSSVFFDFADNDVLKAWLKARAQQMAGLQLEDPSVAARTAVQLIQVISDILGGLSL